MEKACVYQNTQYKYKIWKFSFYRRLKNLLQWEILSKYRSLMRSTLSFRSSKQCSNVDI